MRVFGLVALLGLHSLIDTSCETAHRRTTRRFFFGVFEDCSTVMETPTSVFAPEVRVVRTGTRQLSSSARSPAPTTVRVSTPRSRNVIDYETVYTPDGTRTSLPSSAQSRHDGVVGLKGIEVIVDEDSEAEQIDVIYVSCSSKSTTSWSRPVRLHRVDGTTKLSEHKLLEYFVSSRSPNQYRVRRIGIVAGFDNTTVEIRLPPTSVAFCRHGIEANSVRWRSNVTVRVNGKLYRSGESVEVRLNSYETLAIRGERRDDDLSTTIVRGNRPLYVAAIVEERLLPRASNTAKPSRQATAAGSSDGDCNRRRGIVASGLTGNTDNSDDVESRASTVSSERTNSQGIVASGLTGNNDNSDDVEPRASTASSECNSSNHSNRQSITHVALPPASLASSSESSLVKNEEEALFMSSGSVSGAVITGTTASYRGVVNGDSGRSGSEKSNSSDSGMSTTRTVLSRTGTVQISGVDGTQRRPATYILVANEDRQTFQISAHKVSSDGIDQRKAKVRVYRGTNIDDVTLSYGCHIDVHVTGNEATVVQSEENLLVIPMPSVGDHDNGNQIGIEEVAMLKQDAPFQMWSYSTALGTDDAKVATQWLFLNWKSGKREPPTRVFLTRVNDFNNTSNVTSSMHTGSELNSTASLKIGDRLWRLFKLRLASGFYAAVTGRGAKPEADFCACVRIPVSRLYKQVDFGSQHRSSARREISCWKKIIDFCRWRHSEAVEADSTDVDDDEHENSSLITGSRLLAESITSVMSAKPSISLASRLSLPNAVHQSNKRNRSRRRSISRPRATPSPEMERIDSSPLRSSNESSFVTSSDLRKRKRRRRANRSTSPPPFAANGSTTSAKNVSVEGNSSLNGSLPTNDVIVSSASGGGEAPYLVLNTVVNTPIAAGGGGVVFVKLPDDRQRNEAVVPTQLTSYDEARPARSWNISPTVLAVLGSLAFAGFFVIACIGGFVIADFVCGGASGSNRRDGGLGDQRVRLLAGARRRISSKVSPYFVD